MASSNTLEMDQLKTLLISYVKSNFSIVNSDHYEALSKASTEQGPTGQHSQ